MTEATAGADLPDTPASIAVQTPALQTPAVQAPAGRPGGAWAASTLAALESPVYRLIWFGSLLGFMAFHMSGTAQSVVAFDLTGNNRAVGLVMFGQGAAMLLLNPFGGTIADRLNKRLVLLITQAVLGGVILATAVLLQADLISIPLLAMGAFVTGCMFAFLGPARASILGEVLPHERVGNAVALLQVGGNVGRIIAPFLAGALLSWAFLGASGTYFVIAFMLVFVLVFTWRIPETGARGNQGRSVFDDMKLGLRHVRSRPRLLHAIVSYYLLTMLGFSFFVLMPGFVKQELGRGTAEVGAMLGIAAAGGFVGSVIVASLADSKRASTFLRIAGAVGAAGLVAVGLAPGLLAALVAMVFVGGGVASFQTLNNSVALKLADPAYYGRVMGLMQVAWGMINLTSLPVGVLADELGERMVLSGAGVALAVALVALTLWEKRLVVEPSP
jgi:MFS family permease